MSKKPENGSERKALRSEKWFNIAGDPGMTALYLERYFNFGLTPEELQSGRPIIGIAQTGSDLSPCNRIHVQLEERLRDGIRDAGGVPLVFPVHPIQETGRRPTASLDRNLAYLGAVEVMHGYPLDGVILTTGCDKTTPALLMAAATANLPSIVLSGGPMLDSYRDGKPQLGSGAIAWECRQRFSAGDITGEEFIKFVGDAAPSLGHCNTMGTASTMNSLAEALGMSLPGCASIPAPYRDRAQMAYRTGRRIVDMVHEDLTPDKIMTRDAFENAIAVNTLIGGSTNAPIHLVAVARHMGVELNVWDWEKHGFDLPLLVNCQPAGEHLAESYHRAGGVPAVFARLKELGALRENALSVSGQTMAEAYADAEAYDDDVIRPLDNPLKQQAGFRVLTGNLFDSGIMKTSVISPDFRARFLANPDDPDAFESRVIVFEGPEDYHDRINDPELKIDERSTLLIRGAGPIGYPGAAEVVNMQPPDDLIKAGITALPTIGDGRQSGTSGSPSILNVSPESALGGGMAIVKTGDILRVDLRKGRVDMLISDEEIASRKAAWAQSIPPHQTGWQEIYRSMVGDLSTGMCLEPTVKYHRVTETTPRNNH
ncbi:IlvD/Edd family dehydratase [Pelagibius sp. Alg239-R121]|uniref:IlvD/Edd family dehydratase n=1 Tax=Pelagibius sp. Alg239-R121 TaxID=2993448 RepID=UPI0024A73765|nr:IlvD/Edd family dehydratase [Pelagibius sp. Alg239-R121]